MTYAYVVVITTYFLGWFLGYVSGRVDARVRFEQEKSRQDLRK